MNHVCRSMFLLFFSVFGCVLVSGDTIPLLKDLAARKMGNEKFKHLYLSSSDLVHRNIAFALKNEKISLHEVKQLVDNARTDFQKKHDNLLDYSKGGLDTQAKHIGYHSNGAVLLDLQEWKSTLLCLAGRDNKLQDKDTHLFVCRLNIARSAVSDRFIGLYALQQLNDADIPFYKDALHDIFGHVLQEFCNVERKKQKVYQKKALNFVQSLLQKEYSQEPKIIAIKSHGRINQKKNGNSVFGSTLESCWQSEKNNKSNWAPSYALRLNPEGYAFACSMLNSLLDHTNKQTDLGHTYMLVPRLLQCYNSMRNQEGRAVVAHEFLKLIPKVVAQGAPRPCEQDENKIIPDFEQFNKDCAANSFDYLKLPFCKTTEFNLGERYLLN